jgi:hypothetical protein
VPTGIDGGGKLGVDVVGGQRSLRRCREGACGRT